MSKKIFWSIFLVVFIPTATWALLSSVWYAWASLYSLLIIGMIAETYFTKKEKQD